MKNKLKSYLLAAALLLAGAGSLTSCQDDFNDMNVPEPKATLEPNTTINELKTLYWQEDLNYATKIGNADSAAKIVAANPDLQSVIDLSNKKAGQHLVIRGRVISSDEDGNVFKSLVIQDATGALAISINSYNLYLNYRRGQEVVLDVTDMYIGKYAGLQQLGMAQWSDKYTTWQTTFMGPQMFQAHAQLNGWPELAKIDTLQINAFSQLPSNPDGLRKYQSQIVKFNNIEFQEGGTTTFSTYQSSGVDHKIVDIEGNTLTVRTSGYSKFWNKTLPSGRGDLVAICSYYNTAGWQLIMIDYQGCMNFGNPTVMPGTKDNPCTVDQVVKYEQDGTPGNGWLTGYIVGAVAPEVTEVKQAADIEWQADVTLANTLVIGANADTRDLSQCVVVQLPTGSKLQSLGNLRANPGNYKKQINIRGTFAKVMGTYGLADCPGSLDDFSIEGMETGGPVAGDGTEAKPYNVSQIVGMNPTSTTEAVATGVYVSGYIVGTMPTGGTSTTLSGTVFGLQDAANTNFVIANTPDETDYTKCIGVQLPTNLRDALSLVNKPANLGKQVLLKGDVMKYCGGPGLKNLTEGKLVDGGSTPDTPGTPDTPDTPAGDFKGDFDSFNGGVATPYYTTPLKNATGWEATNCALFSGGDKDSAPMFMSLLGSNAKTMGVCLNGKVGASGVVVSPVLTGGIKTLTFKYGFAYGDTKCKFTINVKQNGSVVKTQTVTLDAIEKFKTYDYSWAVNVTGDFSIEITNDCYSASASNKDRVTIWNLSWD